ncbi:MAG: hypothetical protein KF788_02370 [Piscinibacter sp.]|nr:hypothetical protein [Piscinibacter sp.]
MRNIEVDTDEGTQTGSAGCRVGRRAGMPWWRCGTAGRRALRAVFGVTIDKAVGLIGRAALRRIAPMRV